MRRLLVLLTALSTMALLALPAGAEGAQKEGAVALGPFADQPFDGGEASLTRTSTGITTKATLEGVVPGVYTMWWVIWNAPEECGTPFECTETDLVDEDVEVAIGHAGGAIVNANGKLQTSAHLNEGTDLTGFPGFGLPVVSDMDDASHAEVHLVWRYHGEKQPGLVDDGLHLFDGVIGDSPEYDYYFAVFASPDAP